MCNVSLRCVYIIQAREMCGRGICFVTFVCYFGKIVWWWSHVLCQPYCELSGISRSLLYTTEILASSCWNFALASVSLSATSKWCDCVLHYQQINLRETNEGAYYLRESPHFVSSEFMLRFCTANCMLKRWRHPRTIVRTSLPLYCLNMYFWQFYGRLP